VRLLGNVPNPFNPETIIKIEAATGSDIRLEIVNPVDQRIGVLADRVFPAGNHEMKWDGKNDSMQETAYGVCFAGPTYSGKSLMAKTLKLR
jgi:hypothetical protein